jgi:hypothetical protein
MHVQFFLDGPSLHPILKGPPLVKRDAMTIDNRDATRRDASTTGVYRHSEAGCTAAREYECARRDPIKTLETDLCYQGIPFVLNYIYNS